MRRALVASFFIYIFLLSIYSLFSFSLTDPNLVISSWQTYWQFQQWMWQTFFVQAQLLSQIYVAITIGLWLTFGFVAYLSWRKIETISLKQGLILILAFSLPLLFSYNALSHDVFNYMFNAKMVVKYHSDPHQLVALDFAADPWTRFMHNTHTPAPYGYGWTGLSLLPSVLGSGKFLPTWLLFRLFSLGSLLLAQLCLWFIARKTNRPALTWSKWLLFFANPLILIEVVSNSHNDLWMMVPAVLSLGLLSTVKMTLISRYASLGLLVASISIKLGTLVLLPLWLLLLFQSYLPNHEQGLLKRFWPLLASLLCFIPLLSPRSQQFHPWYLSWVLVWLPLFGPQLADIVRDSKIKSLLSVLESSWIIAVITTSVAALFRYVPWLLAGGYSQTVVDQQRFISLVPGMSIFLISFLILARRSARTRSAQS